MVVCVSGLLAESKAASSDTSVTWQVWCIGATACGTDVGAAIYLEYVVESPKWVGEAGPGCSKHTCPVLGSAGQNAVPEVTGSRHQAPQETLLCLRGSILKIPAPDLEGQIFGGPLHAACILRAQLILNQSGSLSSRRAKSLVVPLWIHQLHWGMPLGAIGRLWQPRLSCEQVPFASPNIPMGSLGRVCSPSLISWRIGLI